MGRERPHADGPAVGLEFQQPQPAVPAAWCPLGIEQHLIVHASGVISSAREKASGDTSSQANARMPDAEPVRLSVRFIWRLVSEFSPPCAAGGVSSYPA